MTPIQIFDVSVLKASAIASSVYISAVIAISLGGDANEMINSQALGFATLFFISLLVYLVV